MDPSLQEYQIPLLSDHPMDVWYRFALFSGLLRNECRYIRTGSGIFSAKSVDRKSTRLNSSHVAISYAVFCLKKKKERDEPEEASATREPEEGQQRRHRT